MEKKNPERTCIVCREKKTKEEFIQISKTKDGKICFADKNNPNGRSIYICKNQTCKEKCIKSKMINKSFKCQVPETVYEDLANECK